MLVTSRHCEPEQSWSMSKYETIFHKPTSSSPRMSNFEPPLSTQPEWQGQYSYLPPGDGSLFPHSYDHVVNNSSDSQASHQQQARAAPATNPPLDVESVKSEPSAHAAAHVAARRSADPLGLRAPKGSPPSQDQPDVQGEAYAQKAAESAAEESLVSTDTPGLSLGSNPISSVSSAGQPHESLNAPAQSGAADPSGMKDQDDDIIDDDDLMDGDGDAPAPAQTAAERTAQRRKMKRFRLTHQQTRFLMSEFAKQPHPDAAHRERLSREIPGLSPRQVQVWFQNRRAKIKRLTADDRDRMIKMRAVPDDFDNVQALHSPYGAVHGLGAPMASPVDFGTPSYADHMMRPLMVDVRRQEADEHMSPTGLSPAFGNIGFNPSATMSNPDLLSPISPASGDRYYPNHMSTPLSAGPHPRSSNPFARQGSLDASMSMQNHNQRQQIRPLQPLHLRDTMSRNRSDTLQSPLRSSMSWKGDSLDYTTYHGGSGSPPMAGRQPPVFPADQMAGGVSSAGLGGYESGSYSAGATVQSPTHLNYPAYPSSNMQPNAPNRSRMRAASASGSLSLNVDHLRNQYRAVSSGQHMQPTAHSPGGRPNTTAPISGVTSSYTASFPSAPLTAPIDYSLPRGSGYRTSGADYSMSQMSAPISQPNDFSHAFQAGMGGSNSRAPMRDSFAGGPIGMGQNQASAERPEEYSHDPLGMHRKRSFTGPGGASTAASQAYGNTT